LSEELPPQLVFVARRHPIAPVSSFVMHPVILCRFVVMSAQSSVRGPTTVRISARTNSPVIYSETGKGNSDEKTSGLDVLWISPGRGYRRTVAGC